ncbi:MAG: HAMP domain-containing sensor histidine kinase [Reichenbachiella sp.]|uniref:sensor histidine kinase n=1 Tax=Reichenbachiella sp. TaxID=2184521 RepID=UPI003266C9C8
MNKPIQPVLLILFFIAVPFLIYAFIQVRSLGEDEEMAQAVYEKQMEAVLFSLNQYADDMMSQWIRRLSSDQQPILENGNDLIIGNESIQLLVLRKMVNQEDSVFLNDYVTKDENLEKQIDRWYQKEDSTLRQLTKYLDAGFQKIQAAEDWKASGGLKAGQVAMTAMVYDQDSVLYNSLMVLEPTYWVEQVLGNKMQEIDQDDFRLGVYKWTHDQQSPRYIYQTDTFDIESSSIKKKLWVLPGMYLSIQPKGESYIDIIQERSKNNLYFLLFSLLTVFIGTALVIRNIRSTLKIAQLKSDFVSNVSHEIRTPLALIRMYAETLMLGRVNTEDKKKHYYQIIHHESGRLTYLVNNILDFSRIEANRKTYHFEEKELNEMVESIHLNFAHLFKEKEMECTLSLCSESVSVSVSVDPQAFGEALSNLIENAVKYSNGSKSIEVSTFVDEGYGCCTVKDYGAGISKAAQKHIFDKFYRVEGALTQKTKGTGLGLSLVKHIMESHQGQVLVDSKPGVGSTFTLKFPLTQ